MLESISSNNIFEYKKLSPEEQKQRGILGRLVGVMADSKNPTRNGRKYSAELWEKVFNNPIMKEKIENRVCFGEACHPTDGREEVDPEKVAICLAEVPKINNKGQLIGVFDVLDTPCGRILKTMLDYGANIGVSSRGSGDVVTGYDGEESVDPDTYDCVCWDAVFVPAVKEARLKLVTESYNGKTLKQALNESVEKASENDRKIMKETIDLINNQLNESNIARVTKKFYDVDKAKKFLHSLDDSLRPAMDTFDTEDNNGNIITWWEVYYDEPLTESISPFAYTTVINAINDGIEDDDKEALQNYLQDIIKYCRSIAEDYDIFVESIDTEESESMPVDNAEGLVEELQKALKENNELAGTITKLQEKLSVSYAKEADLQEEVNRYFRSVKKLSEECKKVEPLKTKVESLTEELDTSKKTINSNSNALKNSRMNLKEQLEKNQALHKEVNEKDNYIRQLKENLSSIKSEFKDKEDKLNENISSLQQDIELKSTEYKTKLDKSVKLVEKYKSVANKAVDKYIDSQARILGVSKQEIKNRLSESYTFDEIDSVCEDLREYKLNLSKLPFRTSNILSENVKMKATPSKNESILPADRFVADEVDEQLMNLAGLQ